jgi:hypothetical protein
LGPKGIEEMWAELRTTREEQVNELRRIACWTTVYRTLQTHCRYKIVDNPSSSSIVQETPLHLFTSKKDIARGGDGLKYIDTTANKPPKA